MKKTIVLTVLALAGLTAQTTQAAVDPGFVYDIQSVGLALPAILYSDSTKIEKGYFVSTKMIPRCRGTQPVQMPEELQGYFRGPWRWFEFSGPRFVFGKNGLERIALVPRDPNLPQDTNLFASGYICIAEKVRKTWKGNLEYQLYLRKKSPGHYHRTSFKFYFDEKNKEYVVNPTPVFPLVDALGPAMDRAPYHAWDIPDGGDAGPAFRVYKTANINDLSFRKTSWGKDFNPAIPSYNFFPGN